MNGVKVTKEIIYRCGCKIMLSEHGQQQAGNICMEHREPVKKVVTTEEHMQEYHIGNGVSVIQ